MDGDGSGVVTLAGGHTTGSVLVFVTLPSGKRYAFIGDLTWQLDGIQLPAERPLLLRKMADSDPEQVRRGLFKGVALAAPLGVLGGARPWVRRGAGRPVAGAGPFEGGLEREGRTLAPDRPQGAARIGTREVLDAVPRPCWRKPR